MVKREFKAMSNLFRLFADENRLKIVFSLTEGQQSVSSIMQKTKLTLVSYHLRMLRGQKLVDAERHGPFIRCVVKLRRSGRRYQALTP